MRRRRNKVDTHLPRDVNLLLFGAQPIFVYCLTPNVKQGERLRWIIIKKHLLSFKRRTHISSSLKSLNKFLLFLNSLGDISHWQTLTAIEYVLQPEARALISIRHYDVDKSLKRKCLPSPKSTYTQFADPISRMSCILRFISRWLMLVALRNYLPISIALHNCFVHSPVCCLRLKKESRS